MPVESGRNFESPDGIGYGRRVIKATITCLEREEFYKLGEVEDRWSSGDVLVGERRTGWQERKW